MEENNQAAKKTVTPAQNRNSRTQLSIISILAPLVVVMMFVFVFVVLFGSKLFPLFAGPESTLPPVQNNQPLDFVEPIEDVPPPVMVDLGTDVSPSVSDAVPVEKGAVVIKSYLLTYPDSSQSTISFISSKNRKYNFDVYTDFLKKNSWMITSEKEGVNTSTLYAKKWNLEASIQIKNTDPAAVIVGEGSVVTISILTKK